MSFARARGGSAAYLTVFGIAAAAAIGYYAGSRIGLALRLPSAVPSVMWPPNAILTAVLLVTPPRLWYAVLLGALPAHIVAQLPTGWPPPLVAALFVTNCGEALLAAAGIRWLNDQPTRFDTLRRFAIFLCVAVIGAPLLSTFADAAAVAWSQGESYWLVWRNRLSSNILAQLVITPAVVGVITRGRSWWHEATVWRHVEAGVLAACLAAASWLAFESPFGAEGAPSLVVLLPFLLWAALRFAPSGTSVALLITTCMAAWIIVHADEPLPLPPERRVFTAQLFFITVAIMLLGVATLVEERRQATQALAERLRFEKLLSEFSRSFVHLPGDQMDAVCRDWLRRIGAFLNLECVRLFQASPGARDVSLVSEWRETAIGRAPEIVVPRDLPWMVDRIQGHEAIVMPRLDALPPDASRDRLCLEREGYKAVLVFPLIDGDRLLGALAFGALRERSWPREVVENLQLLSEVLANAFARRWSEDALRRAEIDAQRSREELAHVGRVATMGELIASLAHQVNQPLTGITSNAQAARHLLVRTPLDHLELREIMSDIVSDARRASDVIRRVREFLRNGQFEMTEVDVCAAIRDVVYLLGSDALIRNIDIELDMDPDVMYVRADRVQLQQVVLNLLVNAMEAIRDDDVERVVRVSCGRAAPGVIRVSVTDTGVGLADGAEQKVFDPFYTTKANGMGMGLSIARSIVETHGGAIQARNVFPKGTRFEFILPVAEDGDAGSVPGDVARFPSPFAANREM